MARGWREEEVRATIRAYFKLLDAQARGEQPKKSAIYEKLAKKYPRRSKKAFEAKFQNISAVLYEERMPFVDGLQPRANYQRLLKLLVLDRLNRTERPALKPVEILLSRLKALHRRGYVPARARGSGRYGLTLEHYLGIPPNSDKGADFMGIELKTKSDWR